MDSSETPSATALPIQQEMLTYSNSSNPVVQNDNDEQGEETKEEERLDNVALTTADLGGHGPGSTSFAPTSDPTTLDSNGLNGAAALFQPYPLGPMPGSRSEVTFPTSFPTQPSYLTPPQQQATAPCQC